MGESGIDVTVFSAHSTPHAATSAAYKKGVSIDDSESSTFGRYYNRPVVNNVQFAKAVLSTN